MSKFDRSIFYKKYQQDVLKIAKKKASIEIKGAKKKYSSSEKYFLEFLWLLAEVEYKLIDLELCLKFINFFPPNKSLRIQASRYDYIVYHLEYYYINIVAIFDRLLHVINFIFNLKLKGAKLTLINVEKIGLVDAKIINLLKIFDKSINTIRNTQNTIKHRLKFQERELDEAQLYEHILKNSEEMKVESKQKMMFRFASKLKYSFYLSKKKKEIKSNNKFIEEVAIKVCDLVLPYFDDQYVQRKTSDSK